MVSTTVGKVLLSREKRSLRLVGRSVFRRAEIRQNNLTKSALTNSHIFRAANRDAQRFYSFSARTMSRMLAKRSLLNTSLFSP
jgi:hypothetical protein